MPGAYWLRPKGRASFYVLAAALLLVFGTAAAQDKPDPVPALTGDVGRGQAIVVSRQVGLCLLCHAAPAGDSRFQGNLAPNLAGTGSRWSVPQLRERVANARSLNPDSIMPAYASTEGLNRVGSAWVGLPLLNSQQIEDVVAYLQTLQD